MFKLKRVSLILLAIVLFVWVTPVFAQARYGLRVSAPIETNTDAALPAGTWVYGIKIYADASSSYMGINDAATVSAATVANTKDDIGEATQYDTAETWYAKPMYFTNGVSVQMSVGTGFIYYGPEPTE